MEGLGEELGVVPRDELVDGVDLVVVLVASAIWVGLGQRCCDAVRCVRRRHMAVQNVKRVSPG